MLNLKLFPIVLTCDDKYAKYASVTISSILENLNKDYYYEINILSDYISFENQEMIQWQARNIENVKIKFIILDNVNNEDFYLNSYMTASTYFRLFIPAVFKEYDRILYLDCDLIINSDISNLIDINFNGELLAAVRDEYIFKYLKENNPKEGFCLDYLKNKLKMLDPYSYFNAGVLVYNLLEIRNQSLEMECLNLLKDISKPYYQDQDILNSFVGSRKGGGKFISHLYNVNPGLYVPHSNRKRFILKFIFFRFFKKSSFFIYHFISSEKPWDTKRFDEIIFYYYVFSKRTPKKFKNEIMKKRKVSWLYYALLKSIILI
ncbi:glycosyltransferase family 8 protein [Gallibacterium trehalosifermentans]|uniref:Glycosyltransferase family 8 protein n=1 Tax=Gallibacterium trehalosifermentans TaxID=516935 RepID=A0ABV6GY34_9PAST